ncbi:MAG: hypothetical protein V3W43_01820 [Desulfatiglandaceae bacterium]
MKRFFSIITLGILFLAVMGLIYHSPFSGPGHAYACNWGRQGGEDYVPQRRGPDTSWLRDSSMTKEQAHDVVAKHINRINPDLRIGPIKDAGSFYETEILNKDNRVVERLGVDKQSGRLMVIN